MSDGHMHVDLLDDDDVSTTVRRLPTQLLSTRMQRVDEHELDHDDDSDSDDELDADDSDAEHDDEQSGVTTLFSDDSDDDEDDEP